MTFIRKSSGDSTKSIVASYTCPEHGTFDAEVKRMENGEAPDEVECPIELKPQSQCLATAIWTPSADIACRVRRIEVTRGKWEKPERKTYLDTRKLGEGQSPEEFQAERKKMWDEQRRAKVKELL